MEVGNGKGTRHRHTAKAMVKGKSIGAKSDKQDKECHMCGKKGHLARDCWTRANQDRTVNQVEGAGVNADAGKEFVYRD